MPTRPPIANPLPTDGFNNTGSDATSSSSNNALTPGSDQIVVLYVIIAFTVGIFGVWNAPILRHIIAPLKLFTIGAHVLGHIVAAIMSGGKVIKVTIDPYTGGATIVRGGVPGFILSAGYIWSTVLGGLFVLAGWDTLIAKILSFVLAVGMLMPLAVVRDKLTILLTFVYEAILIGIWFIDHGQALRWYCLFVGIMNIFFVVWDVADDRFFNKSNDSDATQFSILYPRIGPHLWAALWIMFEVGVLAGFAICGILSFHRTPQQMYDEAAKFLPT